MRDQLRLSRSTAVPAIVVLVLALLPFVLDEGWLTVSTLALVLGIGAIGLSLLYSTGQLSLGHAFFMAVGGYSYGFLAAPSGEDALGLGLPAPVALVAAIALAGFCGLLFSPIGSRLGGLPLAVATLGLVFLGHHISLNAEPVTGGARGRLLEPIGLGGLVLDDARSLWWFVAAITAVVALLAHRLMSGRVGLSLRALHGGELFAGTMGIDVRRRKAGAFVVSSMYAGLSGALFSVVSGAVVPETFDLTLSLNILIMIVLGGTGLVVVGSLVGAVLITVLPELLREYAGLFPFIAPDALSEGISPNAAAQYVYGVAVIAILIAEPGGLAVLARRASRSVRRRLRGDEHDTAVANADHPLERNHT